MKTPHPEAQPLAAAESPQVSSALPGREGQSLDRETAGEHLRNALQLLRNISAVDGFAAGLELTRDALERRIQIALELTESDARFLQAMRHVRTPRSAVAIHGGESAHLVVVCDDGSAFMWAPPVPTESSAETYRKRYEHARMMGQLWTLPHEWCPYHQAIPGTLAGLAAEHQR